MPAFVIRSVTVMGGVLAFNAGVWLLAWLMFRGSALLMGSAILAFSLGLRHAVDADHIAAIDNATRKLMQDGKRPVTVGLWFSLGHSSIVVLLSLLLVVMATGMKQQLDKLAAIGSVAGVVISCLVLFLLAALNCSVLVGLTRTFRRVRNGGTYREEDVALQLARRGLMGRIFSKLFRSVHASWQLYPVGLLFGLGFDTATEIGLLGLSAASAMRGLGLWSIMVFPALFTAGMSLIDTADSVLMLNVYSWSFIRPLRKLYYNITVTAISVVTAAGVGALEALALMQQKMGWSGPFWNLVALFGRNFGGIGYAVIGLFTISWIVSVLFYKLQRYDELDVRAADPST